MHPILLFRYGPSDIGAAGLLPHRLAPPDSPLQYRARTVNGGSDVEVEYGLASGLRRGGVVINDVADFFTACAENVPIVSIEWRGSSVAVSNFFILGKG